MPVASGSLLYADDTCIVFQYKNVTEIEKQPLRDFSSLCDWFVDNKLSVHFGQEKTKSILFGTKHKLRNAKTLNIVCNGTAIKQYEKVNKTVFLTPPLSRLLCNALIQTLFD